MEKFPRASHPPAAFCPFPNPLLVLFNACHISCVKLHCFIMYTISFCLSTTFYCRSPNRKPLRHIIICLQRFPFHHTRLLFILGNSIILKPLTYFSRKATTPLLFRSRTTWSALTSSTSTSVHAPSAYCTATISDPTATPGI